MPRVAAANRTLLGNVPGTALSFPGVNTAYVLLKSGAILSALTNASVSLWFKNNVVTNGQAQPIYCERAAAGNDIWKIEMNRDVAAGNIGKLEFTHRNDAGTLSLEGSYMTSNTYNNGAWHHMVLTKAGSAVKIYGDNVQRMSATLAGNDTLTNAGMETRLGGDIADVNALFAGQIDHLRLFNTTLSVSEVATLFGGGEVSNGLIDAYSFDEASGLIVADSVGSNHGILKPRVTFVTGTINKFARSAASGRLAASGRVAI